MSSAAGPGSRESQRRRPVLDAREGVYKPLSGPGTGAGDEVGLDTSGAGSRAVRGSHGAMGASGRESDQCARCHHRAYDHETLDGGCFKCWCKGWKP